MAGLLPSRRAATGRGVWARELRRAAVLFAASVALFWGSSAAGRWILPVPDSAPVFGDIVLAWIAVVVHVSAWPNLWAGLRDLRARRPDDPSVVVAWRAFLLTFVVVVAALIALPLEYRAMVSSNAWIFVFYVNVFPYLSWSFVPILALHGILFGRIAGSVEPRFRYLADVGALVLFTVAAATIVVILQSPGTTGFVQAWSLSLGILPGAAVFGYALLALGITAYPAPANPRGFSWTRERMRGSSPERLLEIFR